MRKAKLILTTIICICLCNLNVSANTMNNIIIKYEKVYLNGNCYLETIITESAYKVSGQKTGTKQVTYKADGETMWYAELTGTYEYNGTISKCKSASIEAVSLHDTWKIKDKSCSYSGNTAIGDVTAKHYFGFVAIDTIDETIKLTCSKDGTLS